MWRKLASWTHDMDWCNPDKDVIDFLPGANWWETYSQCKTVVILHWQSWEVLRAGGDESNRANFAASAAGHIPEFSLFVTLFNFSGPQISHCTIPCSLG